jgi:S1-C subfamily serine protease
VPSDTRVARAAGILALALLGGGLALAGAAALGRLGTKTTIQQIAAPVDPGEANASLAASSHAQTIEEIYKSAAPGVVQITATTVQTQTDPFGFFPPTTQTAQALGSGFVIDKAGHIITNDHVIAGAQKVQVSFSGNDQIEAKVVGKDPSTDVAVLQIDAHSRSLTPLPLGNSDAVQVGDPVVAIGNPFSLTRTATAGIVSAVQRTIDAPDGLSIDHVIQTDAAINHGNSGGPLLNSRGQVIGVNAQIQSGNTGTDGNVGIGFAIPINTIKSVVYQLIRTGEVKHAFLGVAAVPVTSQLAHLFNLPTARGLLVQQVTAGSPAAKAGLTVGSTSVIVEGESYTLGGDIIVAADGAQVSTEAQLRDLIARKQSGDRITLQIYRGSHKRTIGVTLGPT